MQDLLFVLKLGCHHVAEGFVVIVSLWYAATGILLLQQWFASNFDIIKCGLGYTRYTIALKCPSQLYYTGLRAIM